MRGKKAKLLRKIAQSQTIGNENKALEPNKTTPPHPIPIRNIQGAIINYITPSFPMRHKAGTTRRTYQLLKKANSRAKI